MRLYRKTFAGAALLLGLALPWASAQDDTTDPFNTDQFDQAVEQSLAEDTAYRVDTLFGGTFLLRNYATTSFAFDSVTSVFSLSGRPFIKVTDPRLGSLFLSYSIVSTLYQSSNDPVLSAGLEAADPFAPRFSLGEFFISFDLGKTVFIRAGNQLNAWGPSYFWTPVDFINLERVNPWTGVDLRAGIPSLKLHIPFQGGNLFLFLDFSDTVAAAEVNQLWTTAAGALRVDFTLLGFEFGVTGYVDADGSRLHNKYGFDASGS
ncbi:MAG TPA: hypothetical protein ENN69_05570, partial [Spirochaetia bacterium]|nr:hypothetical protein [Spirochaetia bacterium]